MINTVFQGDNGWVLNHLKNKNAKFVRRIYEHNVYYFAANRVARRYLRSTKLKNLGVKINLELNAFS